MTSETGCRPIFVVNRLVLVISFTVARVPLVARGLLWRAGLPRVGLRSGPETWRCGVLGEMQWLLLGLLRCPTRGKPARHSKPACQGQPRRLRPAHSYERAVNA